jgi:hypothetical protein
MTRDDFNAAREAVYSEWTERSPQEDLLSDFVWLTMERHNVHPAPWTMALLLNWQTALSVFTVQLQARKPEECMKLSRWLVEASAALQEAFAKAGTPAPSGPAEIYRQLLASGYEPPTIIEHPEREGEAPAEPEQSPGPPLKGVRGMSPAHREVRPPLQNESKPAQGAQSCTS